MMSSLTEDWEELLCFSISFMLFEATFSSRSGRTLYTLLCLWDHRHCGANIVEEMPQKESLC